MRFKNVLGLLAIGGAVAYAQKRRGGDMSLNGFKNTFRSVIDNVKGQIGNLTGQAQGQQRQGAMSGADVGGLGSSGTDVGNSSRSGIADDYTGTSGYSSGYGNGIDRNR